MSKITKSRLFELLSARHLNNPYSRLADLPSPEKFKDIDIACKRIKKAILEKETILQKCLEINILLSFGIRC